MRTTRKRIKYRKLDDVVLADVVARIVEVAKPDKIVLFGSAARGQMGPNSDLDLLVIKPGRFNRHRLVEKIYLRMHGAGAAVDVVVVTPEEVERYRHEHCLVIAPALNEGKVVYGAKRYPPNDPREWLNRARSNLAQAKNLIPEAYLEDLCFNAQQAVEKAIKGVFIHGKIKFPYVHDVAQLLSGLEAGGVKIPKYVQQAERLTPHAVESRYPGLSGPVTKREYRTAVRIAENIVCWAERQIDKP